MIDIGRQLVIQAREYVDILTEASIIAPDEVTTEDLNEAWDEFESTVDALNKALALAVRNPDFDPWG